MKKTYRPKDRPSAAEQRDSRHSTPGLRILHEDAQLLICEKQEGLLSATPPGTREISAFRMLQQRYGATARTPKVWIIHRLDRDVSGVMVFALEEGAFRFIKEDFRARRIERSYLALVEGSVEKDTGSIQSFLREDRFGAVRSVKAPRRTAKAPGQDTDEARLAVTHWEVLARGRGMSLLRLRMESGRKHQLRVQLSELGHPIVGDERYGAKMNPLRRIGLHAHELTLRHPANGASMAFKSPAPSSFWNAVGATPPSTAPTSAAPIPAPRSVTPPPDVRAKAMKRTTTERMDTNWDSVAPWYAQLLSEARSAPLEEVVLPGTLALLQPQKGERILDLACGEGTLARRLAGLGCVLSGVDASKELLDTAIAHADGIDYHCLDARDLAQLQLHDMDAVTCVMALMNIDPLDPVIKALAATLKPGGRFVSVMLHPAFRAPRQTSWGLERERDGTRHYRRVDGYLSPGQFEIIMNPGAVAGGDAPITTWTFHRPVQWYVRLFARYGLLIEGFEEWPAARLARDDAAMARLQREIPMFLALRARKV